MATTKARPLPIILDKEEFERLDQLAREQERDAVQQARYMLRCALQESLKAAESDHARREAVAS